MQYKFLYFFNITNHMLVIYWYLYVLSLEALAEDLWEAYQLGLQNPTTYVDCSYFVIFLIKFQPSIKFGLQ